MLWPQLKFILITLPQAVSLSAAFLLDLLFFFFCLNFKLIPNFSLWFFKYTFPYVIPHQCPMFNYPQKCKRSLCKCKYKLDTHAKVKNLQLTTSVRLFRVSFINPYEFFGQLCSEQRRLLCLIPITNQYTPCVLKILSVPQNSNTEIVTLYQAYRSSSVYKFWICSFHKQASTLPLMMHKIWNFSLILKSYFTSPNNIGHTIIVTELCQQ